MQLKSFFTSIIGIATILLVLSFILPWIGVPELTLYGFNIVKFADVYSDGASYKIFFQMSCLLIVMPIVIVVLANAGNFKLIRILAFITSLLLIPLLVLVYVGKSSEISMSIGYDLALVGVIIYFLQIFISFFRRSLLAK